MRASKNILKNMLRIYLDNFDQKVFTMKQKYTILKEKSIIINKQTLGPFFNLLQSSVTSICNI